MARKGSQQTRLTTLAAVLLRCIGHRLAAAGAAATSAAHQAKSLVTFESVGLTNSAILWPNGQEAFRSDPSALSFQHPSGDPNKAVALVFSSDGAASSNVSAEH